MKKFLLIIAIFCTFISAEIDTEDIRFVVVGDRTGDHVNSVFEEIIDEVSLLNPDLVICVGDLIEGYAEDAAIIHAQWDTVLHITGKLSCPFYFVAGNHDLQNERDREIFKERTGFNRYYSFDYKNNHFIVLDNTMTYWALPQAMGEEQIEWLKKDLEKNKHAKNIFVFYHIPTYLYTFRDSTLDSLVEIFEKFGVDAVFTGHHHSYAYLNRNNIEYVNVGSSGGAIGTNDLARGHFYHYIMVTVQEEKNNIVVIRKGSVLARNVVTADDHLLIDRADEEAVTLTTCIVKEGSKKDSQYFTATIDNFGIDAIVQPLKWDYDPAYYTIIPAELPLSIGVDEKQEHKFKFTIANGSDIFPMPRFTLAFPFTYGKVCTLINYIPIKRLVTARNVKTAPVIDGTIEDKVWKTASITNLGRYDGLSPTSIEKTEIYLCHDKANLYIAARCFESDFSQLTDDATEHDGTTYMDDNIWFFFDTNFDQETYYQAIINSKGVVFDRLCSLIDGENTKDLEWNGPWEVKSGREEDAWTLEIKIPKQELKPLNENKWGFNFRRLQTRMSDAGYWSLPFGHNPDWFGIIELE